MVLAAFRENIIKEMVSRLLCMNSNVMRRSCTNVFFWSDV